MRSSNISLSFAEEVLLFFMVLVYKGLLLFDPKGLSFGGVEMNTLYWKVFWIYFGAMALFCFTILLPIVVGDAVMNHGPHTTFWIISFITVWAVVLTIFSLLCAWLVVSNADSADEDVRTWQLQALMEGGLKAISYGNPFGWLWLCIVWGVRRALLASPLLCILLAVFLPEPDEIPKPHKG